MRTKRSGFRSRQPCTPLVGERSIEALGQRGISRPSHSLFAPAGANPVGAWPTTHLTPEEINSSFEAYDADGDGFITMGEMRSVMAKFGHQIDDAQIRSTMEAMDANSDGRIDYEEFASFWSGVNQCIAGNVGQGEGGDEQSIHFNPSKFSSVDTLLEFCADQKKAKLMEGSKFESFMRLAERFKSIDLDGDGLLSPTELFSGLAIEHPTFSPQQIGVIVRRMLDNTDKDGSGNIDLYEFASQFLDNTAARQPQHSTAITVEETPNPRTMKFIPDGHEILGPGTRTKTFRNVYEAADSPLAMALFKVSGVQEVMLAGMHLTVMKSIQHEWGDLEDNVVRAISQFFVSGLEVVKPGMFEEVREQIFEPGSIEEQIIEILETYVKPFVQQDGGDVAFDRFDRSDGTLYLMMQGSCSGCAQSHATLQFGVKNLMDHYVPEVKMIVGLQESEEEELPRAR